MLDFLKIKVSRKKRKGEPDNCVLTPAFVIGKNVKDIMVKGRSFYAVFNNDTGFWSQSEFDCIEMMDNEMIIMAKEISRENPDSNVTCQLFSDTSYNSIDLFNKFVTKQCPDNWKQLDSMVTFSNVTPKRTDYVSKCLPYTPEEGPTEAWNGLMQVLYSKEEIEKIEYAIGSIVAGKSKDLQKFFVFYGAPGTGKSTVMNIISDMFNGYWDTFDTKALSSGKTFALESLKQNPVIAIEQDGDLSNIKDNSIINSLVSHEVMSVNEKFKGIYSMRFNSLLFLGTNKPVSINSSKSGLRRRLIDITPTGNTVSQEDYDDLMNRITFEYPYIAYKCLAFYKSNPTRYNKYVPKLMEWATNDLYEFFSEMSYEYADKKLSLGKMWTDYKAYVEDANIQYPLSRKTFRVEIMEYFDNFQEHATIDGKTYRSVFSGFRKEKFEMPDIITGNSEDELESTPIENINWLTLSELNPKNNPLNKYLSDCPAQYANNSEVPTVRWSDCKYKLCDLDTTKLHYVRPPENLIVIDFDIRNDNGEKDLNINTKEALKFPKTYAETSKSGNGLHLHYIYDGDVTKLSNVYDDKIEIKTFTGKAALRRKLSLSNREEISHLAAGTLPEKKEEKMINFTSLKNEKAIRTLIKRNLLKEYHPGTKPSIDFIKKILDDAYNSGMVYDVSDMRSTVLAFAMHSTNNKDYCVKEVGKMHFKSETEPKETDEIINDDRLVFFDCEVFPNFFCICWKYEDDPELHKMVNPQAWQVKELFTKKLVGFNNRKYDNHILWAAALGYTNEELFNQSSHIINDRGGQFKGTFMEAYNLSYTDIYDFVSKKQSLKKYEIELGIFHMENEYPWDQPLDKSKWDDVVNYCCNDVIATEAVFKARHADFEAREILTKFANIFVPQATVNWTNNKLTEAIIFRGDKNPQKEFVYPDLSKEFPGYKFENGKSYYRGEELGEGGYVYAEPGYYENVLCYDIASQHPHSIIAENGFGKYTKNYSDIVDIRIHIKHKDYDWVRNLNGGIFAPYVRDKESADALSKALKIPINSVYGLTAAKFKNAFRDPRNIDNWVAKRGALFTCEMKYQIQERGFQVVHCKTDSIKIVNPSPDILKFAQEFANKYGYTYEVEELFDKFCLVNDAVYIGKMADGTYKTSDDPNIYYGPWTATGAQFKVPYVFKTLFSNQEISFADVCETKSVKDSLYLDFNENLPEDEHKYKFVGKVGQFTPVIPGSNGGLLMVHRANKNTYDAVTGTKGYRWKESKEVEDNGSFAEVDESYYDEMVRKAVETIEQFVPIDALVDTVNIKGVNNVKETV